MPGARTSFEKAEARILHLEAPGLQWKVTGPHLNKHSFGAEPGQTLLSNSKAALFRKSPRGMGQLHEVDWVSSGPVLGACGCCLEITDHFPIGVILYNRAPSPHDVSCPGRAQQISLPHQGEMVRTLETLKQLELLVLR